MLRLSKVRDAMRISLMFVSMGLLLAATGPRLAIAETADLKETTLENATIHDSESILEQFARVGVDAGLSNPGLSNPGLSNPGAVGFRNLVERARAGEFAEVLPRLRGFLQQHPGDIDVH